MARRWARERDFFTPDPDEEKDAEPTKDIRCTPERLLAFINRLGRMPTLKECKTEFGGILGVLIDGWALQKAGLLPKGR